MSNVVRLRDGVTGANRPTEARDATQAAFELLAASKEDVGRTIFSIDLMVQHARLIVARVRDARARKGFEDELHHIEHALQSARKLCRNL